MKLKIKIPIKFGNIAITKNSISGDTNDSSNWDSFSFPLPEGDWYIESSDMGHIVLVNKTPVYEYIDIRVRAALDSDGSVFRPENPRFIGELWWKGGLVHTTVDSDTKDEAYKKVLTHINYENEHLESGMYLQDPSNQ